MSQVRDLIGPQRAAATGMLGPAEYAGLEESAIDDQLSAAIKQIEQANLAARSVEIIPLLHRHPRHPSTLGGQGITAARKSFLLHEELLARGLPLLLRHDRRCVHCHLVSPFISETDCKRTANALCALRRFALKNLLNLPMHTARIPPVEPAPASISAVFAIHTGHIYPSFGGPLRHATD